MAIFLDSAHPADARRAQELGFIQAITTNPALIAKTGQPGPAALAALLTLFDGTVFYQVTADTPQGRLDEASEIGGRYPGRVVIKLPATTENLSLAPKLPGIAVCITAAFSPAQAYLAAQAGARYVAVYVSRATRLLGDGVALVRDMVDVLKGSQTELLAASIKSVDEAVAVLKAGAHHLTLPLELIEAMGEHALSRQAIEEFDRARAARAIPVRTPN